MSAGASSTDVDGDGDLDASLTIAGQTLHVDTVSFEQFTKLGRLNPDGTRAAGAKVVRLYVKDLGVSITSTDENGDPEKLFGISTSIPSERRTRTQRLLISSTRP